ncbi:MAG: hypothetical protein KF774_19510 [Planctomyces sp.]|nr:hypothetical protein [Planctomyces sp.]
MWFTEAAWPPILILAAIAGVALILAWERRQSRFTMIAAGCVLAAVAVWFIERAIVTERERVEQHLVELVRDFEAGRSEAVLDAITTQSPELRALAALALSTVTVRDLRLTDVTVELSPGTDTRARSHFRVNGSAVLNSTHDVGHQPTRWIARWQRETDRWRIVEIEQLDPITGEPTRQVLRNLRR